MTARGKVSLCLTIGQSTTISIRAARQPTKAVIWTAAMRGIGRTFTPMTDMLSQNAKLYFDGVYMEATVYLNGVKIAENYHGYSPFFADMSGTIKSGRNTIAVFVRNHQPSSRWYSGSGIYRPVYIVTMQKSPISVSEMCVTSPNLETEKNGNVSTHISFKTVNPDATEKTCTISAKICKDGETTTLAQNSASISCPTGEACRRLSFLFLPQTFGALVHQICIRLC